MYKKVRQSNFELLRILCMFGVLTSHSLMAMYDLHTLNFSFYNELRVFIMNASCLAVNSFVLISGYFQIRPSWKSFIGLVSPCFFWSVICSSLAYFTSECSLLFALRNIIFPFTETGLWFMKAYLALYLMAPLLNKAISNMNLSLLKRCTFMLIVIDVYIGYMHQSSEVTVDGYHLIHFVTLYLIANCLKTFRIRVNKQYILGGVILCVLMATCMHMCKMVFPPVAIIYSMRYNSPMLLSTSILLFIYFKQVSIQSNLINRISSSVLSVYLISSLPYIGKRYYQLIVMLNNCNSGFQAFGFVLGTMLIFYFLCIMADQIRKFLCKSIEERVFSFLEKHFHSVFD